MMSARFTAVAATSTTTSPGPGCGSSTSVQTRASGPPGSGTVIAYMSESLGLESLGRTATGLVGCPPYRLADRRRNGSWVLQQQQGAAVALAQHRVTQPVGQLAPGLHRHRTVGTPGQHHGGHHDLSKPPLECRRFPHLSLIHISEPT